MSQKPSKKKKLRKLEVSINRTAMVDKSKLRWMAIFIVLAIFVSFIVVVCFWVSSINNSETTNMSKYLRNKYGQEFVVENVRLTGTGIGVTGAWRADAYPEMDPSLRFNLRRPETRQEYDYDSFLSELWSRQGRVQVDRFLEENLPGVEGYTLRIMPGLDLQKSIQGKVPSFSEIKDASPGKFSYELSVTSSKREQTGTTSDDEARRVLKLIDFIEKQNASVVSALRYVYKLDNGEQVLFEVKNKEALSMNNNLQNIKDNFKILN